MTALPWTYDDGGRADAGFKGEAPGDCVTRAIAIATGRPYREIYDELFERGREKWRGKLVGADFTRKASPRTGASPAVYKPYIKELGGVWTPTMHIGQGCNVHLRQGEMPEDGTLIVRLARHLATVVDGELRDTHDCSRRGTRCVYGYWRMG